MASMALIVGGLGASTLHLAKPRNAWRSLARWRTSWLSREAAARARPAAAGGPLRAGAATVRRSAAARARRGGRGAGLGHARLHGDDLRKPEADPAMAHAARSAGVRPARDTRRARCSCWRCCPADAPGARGVAAGAVAAARGGLHRQARSTGDSCVVATGAITLERAIGVPQGVRPPGPTSIMAARLLDAGHSRGTFLTREFIAQASPRRVTTLRAPP